MLPSAPVSSVLLVHECLSQGEMRVSCSSEGGDSPQYSWTLDGNTLTDAQLISGSYETNSITLQQEVSGKLVCSVRNHVSSVSKEETISTCGEWEYEWKTFRWLWHWWFTASAVGLFLSRIGFIFIDCTSNGTHISQWVLEANNTLCNEPTTTPTTEGKETGITVSNKPSTHITTSNQTSSNTDDQWSISKWKVTAVD